MKIGEKITALRKEYKMTQTELGKSLGVGKTTVSNYETGYSTPDADTIKLLSEIFNTSTDYLIGNTNIRSNDTNTYKTNDFSEFTQEELAILEEIKSDPEISIFFHDLKNASPKEIKHLIWEWIEKIHLNYAAR